MTKAYYRDKIIDQAIIGILFKRELEIAHMSSPTYDSPTLNQGSKPLGLAIEMSQQGDFKNVQIMADRHITKGLGIWAPVICNTQAEADYLTGLCLVLGYSTDSKVFVRGITEDEIRNHYGIDTPPTYIRIPHLPD